MTNQAQTRLLLALWDLGGAKQEVKKGDLTKRIVAKGKKVADFKDIFAELEKKGAIAISKKGYSLESPQGLEVLSEGLKSMVHLVLFRLVNYILKKCTKY
jgi:hypothetical protein